MLLFHRSGRQMARLHGLILQLPASDRSGLKLRVPHRLRCNFAFRYGRISQMKLMHGSESDMDAENRLIGQMPALNRLIRDIVRIDRTFGKRAPTDGSRLDMLRTDCVLCQTAAGHRFLPQLLRADGGRRKMGGRDGLGSKLSGADGCGSKLIRGYARGRQFGRSDRPIGQLVGGHAFRRQLERIHRMVGQVVREHGTRRQMPLIYRAVRQLGRGDRSILQRIRPDRPVA